MDKIMNEVRPSDDQEGKTSPRNVAEYRHAICGHSCALAVRTTITEIFVPECPVHCRDVTAYTIAPTVPPIELPLLPDDNVLAPSITVTADTPPGLPNKNIFEEWSKPGLAPVALKPFNNALFEEWSKAGKIPDLDHLAQPCAMTPPDSRYGLAPTPPPSPEIFEEWVKAGLSVADDNAAASKYEALVASEADDLVVSEADIIAASDADALTRANDTDLYADAMGYSSLLFEPHPLEEWEWDAYYRKQWSKQDQIDCLGETWDEYLEH